MASWLDLFAVAGRVAIGAALLFAGLAKLRGGRERFLRVVLGYELVTGVWASLFGRALPPVEVLVGAFLVVGLFVPVGAVLAFALFLSFALAVAHSLVRGLSNDCGCYGSSTPVQWRLVYRNIVLMGLSIVVLVIGSRAASADAVVCGSNCLWATSPGVLVALLLTWLGTISGVAVLRWKRATATRAKAVG